jgi:hypothetical protein
VAVRPHLGAGSSFQGNLKRIGIVVAGKAVVSKSRRARASMRSFLRKFQRLSALKYPLKDLPEEEGNPTVPW